MLRSFNKCSCPLFKNQECIKNIQCIYNKYTQYNKQKSKVALVSTKPWKRIETTRTKIFRLARSIIRNMPKVVMYLKICEREPPRTCILNARHSYGEETIDASSQLSNNDCNLNVTKKSVNFQSVVCFRSKQITMYKTFKTCQEA